MRDLILTLAVRALVLATLIGILAAVASPAFADGITERQLAVFTNEVERASRELDLEVPSVEIVTGEAVRAAGVSPLAAAFVVGMDAKWRQDSSCAIR